MRTFEEEKAELVQWFEQALKEADEKIAQLPEIRGYDDRAAPIRNAVWHERNRKLVQLKIKHGITLSEKEEEIKKRYKL